MIPAEAQALVSVLGRFYPQARFSAENADAYALGIAYLGAAETQTAIETIVRSSPKLPTVAEIVAEVMNGRRELVRLAGIPSGTVIVRTPGGRGDPSAAEWGKVLRGLLETSARYRRMAERWYQERGKRFPGDPATPFIELAQRGARGEDVLKMAAEVLGVPR